MPVQVRALQDKGVSCTGNLDCPGISQSHKSLLRHDSHQAVGIPQSTETAAAVIEDVRSASGCRVPDRLLPYAHIQIRTEMKTFTLAPVSKRDHSKSTPSDRQFEASAPRATPACRTSGPVK